MYLVGMVGTEEQMMIYKKRCLPIQVDTPDRAIPYPIRTAAGLANRANRVANRANGTNNIIIICVTTKLHWLYCQPCLQEKNQELIAKEELLEDIVSSTVFGSGLSSLLELFVFLLKIEVVLCVILLKTC